MIIVTKLRGGSEIRASPSWMTTSLTNRIWSVGLVTYIWAEVTSLGNPVTVASRAAPLLTRCRAYSPRAMLPKAVALIAVLSHVGQLLQVPETLCRTKWAGGTEDAIAPKR